MIKNYFKLAFRNLLRNKGFSAINIFGLAIGMASAILILLWIQNEVSYDQFHTNVDRLYQVYNRDKFDGKPWVWNSTPKPMAPALKQEYPDVEATARLTSTGFLFTIGDKHFNLNGYFTDPDFLGMFSLPLAKGNSKTALATNNSIVITQKLSNKLFGNEDAMGKIIKIDSADYVTVTGVLKDMPNNTRFQDIQYLLPWSYAVKSGSDDENWGNNSVKTFVLLKPGASEAAVDKKIKNITVNHAKANGGSSETTVFLHPASKWRLYSKADNGQLVAGQAEAVKMFAIIAAFILLIACINFMNLSTARSEKRAKEVGIRKVVGARKSSLIAQFLGESILIAFLAGVVSLIIVLLSLPAFNHLVDKKLFINYGDPYFWFISFGFVLFTGALAGSYPAFYLSNYKPVKVLKGTFKAAHALVTPRKVLVVLQFTFAIGLIICTIIVQHQISYAQNRDAGYKRDNLMYTFMPGDVEKHYDLIRHELLESGAATGVTKTSGPITQHWSDSWGYSWDGSKPDNKIDFVILNTDGDFLNTMGLKIAQGRDIDPKNYPTDTTAMLLNEEAVKVMNFKNPIGQIVKGQGADWHVVGVVKNFILESPYDKITPMIMMGPRSWFAVIHIKLNPNKPTAASLKIAEQIFKKYNPNYPFDYNFIDEEYKAKFDNEQRTGTLAALFAGLTIFISCLGLFGLATYMAENRIKEIGVRKVLGASVANITTLLSKDFLKLVVVSFIIASPVAWYFMNSWLQSYTYRIGIEWWVFAAAGLVSVIIAIGSVSYQAIKAAVANPVQSLRSE